VIWLFAGGGEAEIRGLVPFFRRHFADISFERKTPVIRKPGPRPGINQCGYGLTGRSLVAEIIERLKKAFLMGERCDAILVIDDLDCRDYNNQKSIFINAIIPLLRGFDISNIHVGFSAPELESWIIADWDNSVACHPDFRRRHERMRHWLGSANIPFGSPESFGVYDAARDCCDNKLSDLIIESSMRHEDDRNYPRYSKANHTPLLLQDIRPEIVKDKCPIFKQLFLFLHERSTMA